MDLKTIHNVSGIGNPINAVAVLFDKNIPLWFRIGIAILGICLWTMAIKGLISP